MNYNIGIIGAGIAGLSAALEAKSLGYKVVLFEKIDLVKGISDFKEHVFLISIDDSSIGNSSLR